MASTNTFMPEINRSIASAIQLDTDSNFPEAYSAYLHCISAIVARLIDESTRPEATLNSKNSAKLFHLAGKCLDRASELFQTQLHQEPAPPAVATSTEESAQQPAPEPEPEKAPASIAAAPALAPAPPATMHIVADPMELAIRKNKLLMQDYKARAANVTNEAQRSSMYLSAMRKCVENISAARIQEATLKAKLKERQERLRAQGERQQLERDQRLGQNTITVQQQLQRSFAEGGATGFRNALSSLLSTPGFNPAAYLSEAVANGIVSNIEAAKLSNVIVHDSTRKDARETSILLQEIASNTSNPHSVHKFVLNVFDQRDHPLSQFLAESQYTIVTAYDRATSTSADARDLLESACKEVNALKARLAELLPIAYLQLNNDVAKDQIPSSLEHAVFPPLLRSISRLYAMAYEDDVALFRSGLEATRNQSLHAMDVKEKFWLGCEGRLPPSPSTSPYASAIQTLQMIVRMDFPTDKLEILVQCSRSIMDTVDAYRLRNGLDENEYAVGAEELMPILSHVVAQANVPSLLADSWLISTFMDPSVLLGEGGYALSTFQVLIDHIKTLARPAASVEAVPE